MSHPHTGWYTSMQTRSEAGGSKWQFSFPSSSFFVHIEKRSKNPAIKYFTRIVFCLWAITMPKTSDFQDYLVHQEESNSQAVACQYNLLMCYGLRRFVEANARYKHFQASRYNLNVADFWIRKTFVRHLLGRIVKQLFNSSCQTSAFTK
jgi:hypothetical protein